MKISLILALQFCMSFSYAQDLNQFRIVKVLDHTKSEYVSSHGSISFDKAEFMIEIVGQEGTCKLSDEKILMENAVQFTAKCSGASIFKGKWSLVVTSYNGDKYLPLEKGETAFTLFKGTRQWGWIGILEDD